MDRIHLVQPGDFNDRFDIQVWLERIIIRTDLVGLVRFVTMGGEAILMGKNTDCSNTKLGCRTQDTDGNFTAIGDEDLVDFMKH